MSDNAEPTLLRVKRVAELVGVSDDTVRRWIAAGQVPTEVDAAGRTVLAGADVVELVRARAKAPLDDEIGVERSARNNFVGLVVEVRSDPVMSQVVLQCGAHEVTSLMSTDAVRELGLVPGMVATAVVKATTVMVETKRDG
ncbi:TOBE domain-containing protein [Williamsia sterculiae]|uniref:TOBE domain-containing protein n=1 Tax=Williamsia sterculiae TaxID=1344003 RepID=UPI0009706167|nr:TOBE domain-containing protein [Williamsia sterculiae]